MDSKDSIVVESVPEYTSKELRLLLVGKTGAGKSKLGCNLLDEKCIFPSSTRASSTTEKCAFGQKVLESGSTLVVVDTPGVFDTKIDKEDTALEIVRSITMLSPGPHVVAFVVRVGKLTEEENNALNLLLDLFGEEVYKHLIIVFTRKDDLEEEDISEEEYINSSPDQFQEFLRKVNCRYVFINNRAKGNELKSQISAVMQLVYQLIRTNNSEYYTNKMYQVTEEKLAVKRKEIEDRMRKNGEDITPGRVEFMLRKEVITNTGLIKHIAMGIVATMFVATTGLALGGVGAALVGAEVVGEALLTGAVATHLTGCAAGATAWASGFWGVLKKLRLLLVGKTGAGKSQLGCNLLDEKCIFPSSTLASSTTEKCAFGQKVLESGSTLVVVDTPGVFDTKIDKEDTALEIVRSITMLSPGPHVVAFVVRVGKLTEEENNALNLLLDLFGEEVYKHLIIVFTRKDDLEEGGILEEKYINSSPDQFQEFLRKVNCRYVFINNRAKGNELKSQISAVMQLVYQLIRTNNSEYYTNKMYQVTEEKLAVKRKEIEDRLRKNGEDITPGRVEFMLRKEVMTNTGLITQIAMGIVATMLVATAGLTLGGVGAVLVGAEVVGEALVTGAAATYVTAWASGFWCILKRMYNDKQ